MTHTSDNQHPPSVDDPLELNALEQIYWQRLLGLFAQVEPKKPEKGARTLILRARRDAARNGLSLKTALERMFEAAEERTKRRVELLNQCVPRQDDR